MRGLSAIVRPETKYAKSGSVQIAYQVTGNGPIDLVWAPGTVSHLDLDWEWPARVDFIQRLSSFSRLIRFDKRGTGLSDRPTNAATLDERIDDIRAVMDGAGSQRAALFGVSEGGSMSCLFSSVYPDRTRALILWGTQARWTQTDDYPWGLTQGEQERLVNQLAERGVDRDYIVGPGAGVGGAATDAYVDWFVRYCRAGGSPSAVAALERMNTNVDVRGILPSIHVPTLVMNRTHDPIAPAAAGKALAARIPGAKFVEWPGDTHAVYGLQEEIASTIQLFLNAAKPPVPSDRVLATIVFADIVGSTEAIRALGDARWKALYSRATAKTRQAVETYRGRLIKETGDGYLATFDGPSRAIQCAREVGRVFSALDLPVRTGLHTGECELLGEDIGGVAVNLAARVMGAAGAGEVLVTSTVRDLVSGAGFVFRELGPTPLKGFSEKIPLFVVV